MRYILLLYLFLSSVNSFAKETSIFTTSKCFDLIASLQNFEKLTDEDSFLRLSQDTTFIKALNAINEQVTASKLCNFFAKFTDERNDLDSCARFFNMMNVNSDIQSSNEEWIKQIRELQPELSICFNKIIDADFSRYWENVVSPKLETYISSYPLDVHLLNNIHNELDAFSGPEGFPDTQTKIYVMNIDNAFSLMDESFCCTPLLLNPEIEKQYRFDFIKVYIHENLHKLYISRELMSELELLMQDEFYRENEQKARGYNEGKNEAFIVAAEVYISRKLGRRDAQSVYDEFKEYIDGSLVLAPIIYTHLTDKSSNESYNDFLFQLFSKGLISSGKIKQSYTNAMHQLYLNTI